MSDNPEQVAAVKHVAHHREDENLIDTLADRDHLMWAGWMEYLFGKCKPNTDGSLTIPSQLVSEWSVLLTAKWRDIPERRKKSCRQSVNTMLKLYVRWLREHGEDPDVP